MAACTFFASEPQTVLRSAGLGSVLTAARRHPGGVARTLAERASRERMSVDFMVVEKGLLWVWKSRLPFQTLKDEAGGRESEEK